MDYVWSLGKVIIAYETTSTLGWVLGYPRAVDEFTTTNDGAAMYHHLQNLGVY